MKHSLTVSWKVFSRTLKLAISYLLLLFISIALPAYLYKFSPYLADFMSVAMNIGMVGFIFFAFISYEYLLLTTNPISAETLSPIPGAIAELVTSQLLVLITLLLVQSIIPFVWLMWAATDRGIAYSGYVVHSGLSVVINCLLPGLIGVLLGAVLALKVKRTVAYCVMLVFALLCSPIATQLFAMETIAGIQILDIFDWFAILAPNLNWVADAVYGVAMEVCRWILALFWISALIAILVWSLNRGKKRYIAFLLAALSVVCGMRFAARGNDSLIRKDYRSDGALNFEWSYRNENPIGPEQSANFNVESYELTFVVHSKLEATAVVTVSNPYLREYLFTLYHNLTIHSITDELGQELSYTQNGDYLTIQSPTGAKELHFNYSGNLGKYFTNYQGIALPGYVPYYPMAGHVAFWNGTTNNVIANTDFPVTHFKITVNSPLDVVCNLTETSHNSFEGNAGTISLYGGLLVEAETDGLPYYCSPLGSQSLDLNGYQEIWAGLCDLVGTDIEFDLTGKTVFQQPITIMASGGGGESVVVFDDHIIVGNIAPNAEYVCETYFISLIPNKDNTSMLRNVFQDCLNYDGNEEVAKPAWDELEILTKFDRHSQIHDEEEWFAYVNAESITFRQLYIYQLSTLGRETVMHAVYEYLMRENHEVNQVEFLYNLGG